MKNGEATDTEYWVLGKRKCRGKKSHDLYFILLEVYSISIKRATATAYTQILQKFVAQPLNWAKIVKIYSNQKTLSNCKVKIPILWKPFFEKRGRKGDIMHPFTIIPYLALVWENTNKTWGQNLKVYILSRWSATQGPIPPFHHTNSKFTNYSSGMQELCPDTYTTAEISCSLQQIWGTKTEGI